MTMLTHGHVRWHPSGLGFRIVPRLLPRLVALLLVLLISSSVRGQEGTGPGRFMAFDVFIEAGAARLAAYQVEIAVARTNGGLVQLVGVEGGGAGAFRTAPYYDPAALQGGRVVIAALSTAAADQLPRGRVRVATLHWRATGPSAPSFSVRPVTAADAGGQAMSVQCTVEERKTP